MSVLPGAALYLFTEVVEEIPYFGTLGVDAFLYQSLLVCFDSLFLLLTLFLLAFGFHYCLCLLGIGDSKDFRFDMRFVERHTFDLGLYNKRNPVEGIMQIEIRTLVSHPFFRAR